MTVWVKELYPGSPSLWALDQFPWQLALPWQYGGGATVWTILANQF